MSAAALTQLLIDVTRGHRKADYGRDPVSVVSASRLDQSMRSAVLEGDVGSLWLAGAHPMALLYFARSIGWTNDQYYRCIEEAELRKAAPAAARRSCEPAPIQRPQSNARHAR